VKRQRASLQRIAAETSTPPARGQRGRRPDEFSAERQVYEPHRVGLPPIGPYLRELWRRREFAFELARTNMRAQHLDTVFGRLWLILNPLLLAGVYFILVDIIRKGPSRGSDFLAHLIAGIFAYYFVSGSVREGARTVTRRGRLVLNTAFPRMLLPLSSVIGHFLRFLPTLLIYAVIHLATGLPVNANDLLLIPLVALFTMVAAGLAMLVSTTQVYFRDLAQFLPYILRVWLYLSPVLYFVSEVPDKYRIFIWLNPIGALLKAWSEILVEGKAPDLLTWSVACGWAFGLVIVGGLVFMSRERDFAVRL
jgi:teichoic acid transport system permease protein